MQNPDLTQACSSFWRTLIDQCQQALHQARDETEFRDNFCRALVATGSYRAAWIGLGGTEQGRIPTSLPSPDSIRNIAAICPA